jgi:hypothetical protein
MGGAVFAMIVRVRDILVYQRRLAIQLQSVGLVTVSGTALAVGRTKFKDLK